VPEGRDRAFVVVLAVFAGVRAGLVGGVVLTFLYLAGALPVRALVGYLVVVLVLAALMAVGYLRLARRAGR
jgi:hypothetical protein